MIIVLASIESAAQESVIYTFGGPSDGENPMYGLIADASGSLYGTTYYGGSNNGTVFQLTPNGDAWTERVLYTFLGGVGDGQHPNSGLVPDPAGAFYGITYFGGSENCGTVFKLVSAGGVWSETVVYSFTGGYDGNPIDGCSPYDDLIFHKGVLYGTTANRGRNFGRMVYSLRAQGSSWKETIIYNFNIDQPTKGFHPVAGVISDKDGNLYGTTFYGGAGGSGIVFELSPPQGEAVTWRETVLYSFTGGSDGANPEAGLTFDRTGAVYGTTELGGDMTCSLGQNVGCGTVFRLSPPAKTGAAWTEQVLYAFKNGQDGAGPIAKVVFDSKGILYGTTDLGGYLEDCPNVGLGCGAVFRLTPRNGKEQPLYDFTGLADGGSPGFGPVLLKDGMIYGTTVNGGFPSFPFTGVAYAIAQ